MTYESMRDWLTRRLTISDDLDVAAGGSIEDLRRDADARSVTPAALAHSPSELGRVLRFVREQRGWSTKDLADLADVEEEELLRAESQTQPQLAPRSAMKLAEVCGFSKVRFQQLANHVVVRQQHAANEEEVRYAANSRGIDSISKAEFDTICALIQVLTKHES